MDYWIWMTVVSLGLFAILFFNRQIKVVVNVLRNAVLGVLGIILCNMLLASSGIAVGVNVLTTFIVGFLGLPGFFLLYLTQGML